MTKRLLVLSHLSRVHAKKSFLSNFCHTLGICSTFFYQKICLRRIFIFTPMQLYYIYSLYIRTLQGQKLNSIIQRSIHFQPNQYPPITILVARTQCVFSVSLRTGKRRARTTVKRIVISPADKQKQTTPTLSYYQSQSCCAGIVSLEPGVISWLYCLSAWVLFLFKGNLQVR